jgi:hypothetical protein
MESEQSKAQKLVNQSAELISKATNREAAIKYLNTDVKQVGKDIWKGLGNMFSTKNKTN